jgi:hypothetical protein
MAVLSFTGHVSSAWMSIYRMFAILPSSGSSDESHAARAKHRLNCNIILFIVPKRTYFIHKADKNNVHLLIYF